jgi:hypothetical protein
MQLLQLQAIPSQFLRTTIANQDCSLKIYQRRYGLFFDLYANDVLVIGGVLCHDRVRLVVSEYLGFVGDFTFVDSRGTDDPVYTGLSDRFQLWYLSADDLTTLGLVG